MEIIKALFDASDSKRIVYYDAFGNSQVKEYPPKTHADKAIVKKLGGHHEISHATYRHNEETHKELLLFERFRAVKAQALESFNISVIINNTITKTELMKLKMSIFEHEFVKKSKNTELLTKIRKSNDPVDLVMYFGMLRNDSNNGS